MSHILDDQASLATDDTRADSALLIARLAIAVLFLWAGVGKAGAPEAQAAYIAQHGLPAASVLVWAAAAVELLGGALLLIGWQVRSAALVLAVYTIVAAIVFHAFWSAPAAEVMMQKINFMKNLAIAGGLIALAGVGGGRYAIVGAGRGWRP